MEPPDPPVDKGPPLARPRSAMTEITPSGQGYSVPVVGRPIPRRTCLGCWGPSTPMTVQSRAHKRLTTSRPLYYGVVFYWSDINTASHPLCRDFGCRIGETIRPVPHSFQTVPTNHPRWVNHVKTLHITTCPNVVTNKQNGA